MAFVDRSTLGKVSHGTLPPFAPGPHSISAKVVNRSHKPMTRKSDFGRGADKSQQSHYENANGLPGSKQQNKVRQVNERDHIRQSNLLVPGYKSSQQQKALAKLSGVGTTAGGGSFRLPATITSPSAQRAIVEGGQSVLKGGRKESFMAADTAGPEQTFYKKGKGDEAGRGDRKSVTEIVQAPVSPLLSTGGGIGKRSTKKGLLRQGGDQHSISKQSLTKLPKLSEQVKQQMNEANKLEFPMARFMFQDMEFPDTQHYKTTVQQMKRGYEEHKGGARRGNESETVTSEGVFNVRAASDRKKAALAAQKALQKKERMLKEEDQHRLKSFDLVKGLVRNESTDQLVEKHKEALDKMHKLHKEAQDSITAKDRLQRYTVNSSETDNINKNYLEMQNEIEGMVFGLEKKVRSDEYKFMEEFTDRLRILHARYRELENQNMHLSSMEKFSADIDEMMKERDELNKQCSSVDSRIRTKQQEFIKLKKQQEEIEMEHNFLESQVGAAELNQFKLDNRQEELSENIKTLSAHLEAQKSDLARNLSDQDNLSPDAMRNPSSTVNEQANQGPPQSHSRFVNITSASNLHGEHYVSQVKRNFAAFKMHIMRKNELLRQANTRKEQQLSPRVGSDKKRGLAGMIKESQDEIMELSQPFKLIFEDSINDTKEQIVQRNIKSRIAVAKATSSTKRPDRDTLSAGKPSQASLENIDSSPARPQPIKHIESKQMTFSSFTESDRRQVMQSFLSSQEVLFLIYGLMFPSQTIAAANQALNTQQD